MFWPMFWSMFLALPAADGRAATAYVTDELVLGVYAAQNTQGPRLATLHSGAQVETLAVNGDSTQVRLTDGTTGWVKTAYLITTEPATVRIKQLQEELDRSRATTPELAEAAERNEVERLTRELAKRSELGAAGRGGDAAAGASAMASGTGTGIAGPGTAGTGAAGRRAADGGSGAHLGLWGLAVVAALGCGFWLGYAALARRIKFKFGGIKVY
jgi:hypothetical protein